MAIEDRGKTSAFYGDLISSAIGLDIVRITSLLDSLSKHDLVFLSDALENIQTIIGILLRTKRE